MTGWGQQLLTFNSWKHEGLNSQEERHCGQTEADSPSPSPSCSSRDLCGFCFLCNHLEQKK
ncbi:hypothetical protein LEMLEM_LOCUS16151 [Lemmus lemmus]